MYFVDHLYKGKRGPNIEVEGKLLRTPMAGATYDSVIYSIEITKLVEQQNLSALSRNFNKNFKRMAVEHKWPIASAMINKMVYHDFYIRGKIINPELRAKYLDLDLLPADLIDVNPETKERTPIEFYPPKIKCNLKTHQKIRNKLETDVMDEKGVTINPFDFKKGNLIKISFPMDYAYYQAQVGAVKPNEYGVPFKLSLLQRLNQNEEAEGSQAKRVKWSVDDSDQPQTQTPTQTLTDQKDSSSPPQPPTKQPEKTENELSAAAVAAMKAQMNLPLPTTTTTTIVEKKSEKSTEKNEKSTTATTETKSKK